MQFPRLPRPASARALALLAWLPTPVSVLPAQDAPTDPSARIEIREVLAVGRIGRSGRSPVRTDTVAARLADGSWTAPEEGGTVAVAGDEQGRQRTWTRFEADEDGWFGGRAFRGGWAHCTVRVPETGPWRLDLQGASMVYVDGEPRAGDVYGLGLTRMPLHLSAGSHELLFRTGRGRLRATLERAPATFYLEEKDRTLPDVVAGDGEGVFLGHLVCNASPEAVDGLAVRVSAGGVTRTTPLPALGPSSMRKCRVPLARPSAAALGDALEADGRLPVEIVLLDPEGAAVHATRLSLAVRDARQTHTRTFVSAIDGSVQYFSVVPPPADAGDGDGNDAAGPTSLVLSLHGASVEARGQAACYRQRPDVWVAAPTNRRPFGFDWEDQGRLDALEVLDLALALSGADPRHVYLTGHSMGGHGTWQIGVTFPDRFAAIGPSAGWREFWTYAGGSRFPEGDAVGALLARAANPSRTSLLTRNLQGVGVYVLHGDSDRTVPVREARAMREVLAGFHTNFAYYEQPGAGHWWGNQCVDWPPMFDFFARNTRPAPADVRRVEFVTAHPGVSATRDWVTVTSQIRWLEPSRIVATVDAGERTVDVETENVDGLALDLSAVLSGEAPARVTVDGTEVVPGGGAPSSTLRLTRSSDGEAAAAAAATWATTTASPVPSHKNPSRAGPFKDAFRNGMVFVYGTHGTAEENAWSYAKARYDHETWRYRGNGAVDVVPDSDFVGARDGRFADRNVILYGHRAMNRAFDAALPAERPFAVDRGALRIGTRRLAGDDLALLAVQPRRGSDRASVGVVAGTGLAGLRTTDDLPYFVSGVAYPDWTVLDASFLREGLAGIRGAGFFADDWSLGDDLAWRGSDG